MFKSINDASVYDQGLDKGATEIWFMRPGQARDLGMGSKFLLKQALPLPSPDNLKGTHVLLGKIKEKDPNRVFALMQGENWSPNGEARNLVQRAGTDHTSMMQGDIMKIGDRVLMIDQGMSFYDFKKGQKVQSSVTTAGRPLSKVKKTMAPHMWVISLDSAGGYLVTIGDPQKSSSKIKQSFHGTDAKDELLYWAKYNIGKKVSEDHVIDQTGLRLAPAEFTQWHVENIMFKKGQKVHSSLTTAGRPLSKVKKTMAPHMWVISRDPAGGYLVTIGDPKKSSSTIKQSFHGTDAKDELLYWAKYNIGKKVSEDHVIDQTGLRLAPAEFTQWHVENIMSASTVKAAGKDRLVPYVIKVKKTFGRGHTSSMEFDTKRRGKPNAANLAKWVEKFNESLEPGGPNAHLGSSAMILEADLVDQRSGERLATYKMKNPPMFVAWSFLPLLDVVAEELERRGKRALATQVDDVASDFADFAKAAPKRFKKNQEVEIDDITSIPEGHTFSWRGRLWDVKQGGVVENIDGSSKTTLKEVQDTARANETKIWAKPKYLGKSSSGYGWG